MPRASASTAAAVAASAAWLWLLWSADLARLAAGHAYLYEPPSRNLLAHVDGHEMCPHCGQGGGPDNVKTRGGDVWPSHLAPSSHGLCGDPFQGRDIPPSVADETYLKVTYPPQRTYTAGSVVEFAVAISTHHRGHYEFRLCDKKLDATLPSADEGQRCLDRGVLERVPPDASCEANDPRGDCQPIDPRHKGRWYLPPEGQGIKQNDSLWRATWTSSSPAMTEVHSMRYRIPDGASCERCTLQWWWVSANTCLPDEDYFAYFRLLAELGWDAAKWSPYANASWATKDNAVCGPDGTGSFSEESWNCADVVVLPASATVATTTARAPGDAQTTGEGEGEGGGACLRAWSQCGGPGWTGNGACCDGLRCRRGSDARSTCVPMKGSGGGGGDGGDDGDGGGVVAARDIAVVSAGRRPSGRRPLGAPLALGTAALLVALRAGSSA